MARDHVITTDYTPISTRFLLAPSSRPHSPSTSSSFSKQVSLLSQRLTALDQERRKLGPNHLTTFMLGLEGLESTILKGEIKGRSPWSHSEQKEEDQSTEEDELQGIPLNMEEWEEWEKKKIERRQAKEIEQEEKEAEVKVDVKTKAMKRRRTSEEELSTGIETPKSSDNSRRKRSKDKPINAMFSASKQSSTSASNKKPERPPSVTPRASLKSKSQSFPSLDTLNSAGKSLSADLEPKKDGNEKEDSHRRGESWRSGEEGAEEEVLGEVGHGSQVSLQRFPPLCFQSKTLLILSRVNDRWLYPLRQTSSSPRTLPRLPNRFLLHDLTLSLRLRSPFRTQLRMPTLLLPIMQMVRLLQLH